MRGKKKDEGTAMNSDLYWNGPIKIRGVTGRIGWSARGTWFISVAGKDYSMDLKAHCLNPESGEYNMKDIDDTREHLVNKVREDMRFQGVKKRRKK